MKKLSLLILFGLLIFIGGCKTTPQPRLDVDALMKSDPRLPSMAVVEATGTLAVQRVVAINPEYISVVSQQDTYTTTNTLVTTLFKIPIEQLISEPVALEIALLSLAHQWGRVQIQLDQINRYEYIAKHREAKLEAKKKSLFWSNMALAMSSGMAAGQNSNPDTSYGQRLSNEMAMNRNQQTSLTNRQVQENYDKQGQSIESIRVQIAEFKSQLLAYSEVLEIYANWLMKGARAQAEVLSADAVQILEIKANLSI